jgi:hypothetical protein
VRWFSARSGTGAGRPVVSTTGDPNETLGRLGPIGGVKALADSSTGVDPVTPLPLAAEVEDPEPAEDGPTLAAVAEANSAR